MRRSCEALRAQVEFFGIARSGAWGEATQMTSAHRVSRLRDPSERGESRLADLIPIAVVIGAGCERCAKTMVERALRRGSAEVWIDETLRVVEHLPSLDCFRQAVGPEAIGRMEKSLEAGRKTLREATSSKAGAEHSELRPTQRGQGCDNR
jgi:alkylhydroperoxidase/carboxymuconolactone decarboxylase family protein YurZ